MYRIQGMNLSGRVCTSPVMRIPPAVSSRYKCRRPRQLSVNANSNRTGKYPQASVEVSPIEPDHIRDTGHSQEMKIEERKLKGDGARKAWMAFRGIAVCVVGVCALHLLAPKLALASTGEKLASKFAGYFPNWAVAMMIAAFPIVELRGAIPVSVGLLGMDPINAALLAIVGNMLPIPFILLFLGPLSTALSKFDSCKRFFDWLFERSRNQGAAWKKNEFLALTLFVGVPLPGTGAWSGAMGAFVLGMPFGKALLANFLGVLLAATIVTSLTMMGWKGLGVAVLALIILPGMVAYARAQDSATA